MEIKNFQFVYVLSTTIFSFISSENVIITTTGPIRGKKIATENLNVDAYLGIPFAEPPIGDLRFRKPVPIKPWSDVYDATKKPFPCCQNATQKLYWMPKTDNMTEDCLYLNVWVPNVSTSNKKMKPMSVMVWIYGGAFNLGSSDMDVYDGAQLAAYGEVIVASLNYRIGVFGFMTALIEDANGNMGLYDQILALQWIKDNVAKFGGDPEQITLFGESAGAMSIALHLISPLTQHLFKRAILESGASVHPLAYHATDNQIKTSNKIAQIVGCTERGVNITTHPQRVVDCLKRVPIEELTRAEGLMKASHPITLYPRYGDEYMPSRVDEAMDKFQYKNTEILIGNNVDEGSFFLTSALPDYFGIYGWDGIESISKRMAKSLIKGIFQFTEQKNIREIADFYVGNVKNQTSDNLKKAIYDSLGDYMITCNNVFFSDFYSRNNNKVYYYVFTHRPSTTILANWVGTTHFDEIQYIFGNPLNDGNFTSEEEILSRRVMNRWISFAKTGNPNIPGEVKWPPYAHNYPAYLNIDLIEEIKRHPGDNRCEFWRDRFMARINSSEIAEHLVGDSESATSKVCTSLPTIIGIMVFFYSLKL